MELNIDTLISYVVLLIVIVFLLSLIVWDRIQSASRERVLTDRLMSRNFGEYVTGSQRMATTEPDNKLSIEEAVDALAAEGVIADEARSPAAVIRVGS